MYMVSFGTGAAKEKVQALPSEALQAEDQPLLLPLI
jgi:hypothetical protein